MLHFLREPFSEDQIKFVQQVLETHEILRVLPVVYPPTPSSHQSGSGESHRRTSEARVIYHTRIYKHISVSTCTQKVILVLPSSLQ